MNFSTFLQKIYKNKNNTISRQDIFVKELFESTGIDFYYGEDYAKKIFNGSKPLSNDVRKLVPRKYNQENVITFLKNCINPNRLQDLLDEFDIEKDEKKDLNILIKALEMQFGNYIKYGENVINTTVKSIYESLIDEANNVNVEDANEIALFQAKQLFYNAINTIDGIKPDKTVLNLKGPFESFFRNIYNIFKILQEKCNRKGRSLFKQYRNQLFENEIEINKYLQLISEPGSLPLDLIKKIKITIFNNITFEDIKDEFEVKLFDDLEHSKLLEILDTHAKDNEMFFSEEIIFNLTDSERNLIEDMYYIIEKINTFLKLLQNEFNNTDDLGKIDNIITRKIVNLQFLKMIYNIDSIYYKKENKIETSNLIEMIFINKEGTPSKAGDHLISFDKNFFLYDNNFKKVYQKFYMHELYIYVNSNFEPMNELITINSDGSCRYYMFVPTSKSKLYRKIREIASKVFFDKTVAFLFQMTGYVYPSFDAIKDLTYNERSSIGEEIITTMGYYNGKYYSNTHFKKDIVNNNYKRKINSTFMHILQPIINNINLIEEEISNKKIFND